jgi:carbamoyltransferase
MMRQLFEYQPDWGYRFTPGLKARVDHEGGGYLVRVNEAGFRCRHEFRREKSPGVFRVLLFGDSYTAGDGVSNKDRYGDVLEALLPGLEVYNFGLSGSGTDQQYLIYRGVGSDLEHDLVLIGVLVENIRRVAARFRPYQTAEGEPLVMAKPYFSLEPDGSLALHQVPVPREPVPPSRLDGGDRSHIDRGGRLAWLREVVNRAGPLAKDVAQRLTRYQPLPEYDRSDDPAWQLTRAILLRWISELRAPAVVCPIPLYQYVEGTASARSYRARFRELESEGRVRVHDPLDDLRRRPAAERRALRFVTDCHLTPAGHRALAESLAPCIASFMPAGTA